MAEPFGKCRVIGTEGLTLTSGCFVGFGLGPLDGTLSDTSDTITFAGSNIYDENGNRTSITVTLSNGVFADSTCLVKCNHIKPENYPCIAYFA